MDQRRMVYAVEKACKKFFPPTEFMIIGSPQGAEERKSIEERLKAAKASGEYRLALPGFEDLELRALLALEHQGPHCGLAVDTAIPSHTTGRGIQSHLQARALLIEVIDGHSRGATSWHVMPFISEFTMPFLGTTGATHDQLDRCFSTVLRGVIEGWQFNSSRYPGILRELDLIR